MNRKVTQKSSEGVTRRPQAEGKKPERKGLFQGSKVMWEKATLKQWFQGTRLARFFGLSKGLQAQYKEELVSDLVRDYGKAIDGGRIDPKVKGVLERVVDQKVGGKVKGFKNLSLLERSTILAEVNAEVNAGANRKKVQARFADLVLSKLPENLGNQMPKELGEFVTAASAMLGRQMSDDPSKEVYDVAKPRFEASHEYKRLLGQPNVSTADIDQAIYEFIAGDMGSKFYRSLSEALDSVQDSNVEKFSNFCDKMNVTENEQKALKSKFKGYFELGLDHLKDDVMGQELKHIRTERRDLKTDEVGNVVGSKVSDRQANVDEVLQKTSGTLLYALAKRNKGQEGEVALQLGKVADAFKESRMYKDLVWERGVSATKIREEFYDFLADSAESSPEVLNAYNALKDAGVEEVEHNNRIIGEQVDSSAISADDAELLRGKLAGHFTIGMEKLTAADMENYTHEG